MSLRVAIACNQCGRREVRLTNDDRLIKSFMAAYRTFDHHVCGGTVVESVQRQLLSCGAVPEMASQVCAVRHGMPGFRLGESAAIYRVLQCGEYVVFDDGGAAYPVGGFALIHWGSPLPEAGRGFAHRPAGSPREPFQSHPPLTPEELAQEKVQDFFGATHWIYWSESP